MTREQLLHIIRAAAKICEESEFVIVGSQAAHGSIDRIDEDVILRSMEADIYPLRAPEKTERLNVIGELSSFHEEFGCYADPVDETTAILPESWLDRVEVLAGPLTENDHGLQARGYCPELHDLAISKLIRGLDKDVEFVQALDRRGLLRQNKLLERLRRTRVRLAVRRRTREYILAFVSNDTMTPRS